MVMEGIQEDMGDGNMICTNHPYKNNTPGGICAFCLQEKLGKLVSSSFPSAVFPSSSSSSTPSFRSDFGATSSTLQVQTNNTQTNNIQTNVCNNNYNSHYGKMRKSRMPFLLSSSHYNKKKKDGNNNNNNNNGSSVIATTTSAASNVGIVMKRSKSTTTPRNRMHFLDNVADEEDYTPHRKRFWSFLYYSSSSKQHSSSTAKRTEKNMSFPSSSSSVNGSMRARDKKKEEFVVVEENESPNEAAFDRKVSRSRSVGCGSRSFSGDFFERISTGFGDCTLRRVESQREGKSKVSSVASGQDCIKERVRCGGLFSGFMITSSSSSSSSSSHWVSSEENMNGKSSIAPASVGHQLVHGRSKSWGWAFASPMRAFSKTSSNGKRGGASNKNATPNLTAIPSLLTARG
ncbi:uncharacterized protein LOC132034383 [Lycium ferocissimum]|uniref:uncharacterized protein LOC132034383 n=1 Tax=Lycium ferocissimum TaxID=112874 RepID=UPI0028161898|nr:uncharacterized protein LOC132034383 [Lycium ferocissimum]